VEHAIWWQVYPLGFLDAPKEQLPLGLGVQHRLPALEGWLDYLIELGASGLLLGPIFEAASHGYDTVDYFSVDRRLGDTDDVDALVAQAHARGIRVLLDGVFNHVGRDFPRFREALRDGPTSPAADWFHLQWPATGLDEPDYEDFEGHRQLVALNHASPAVADFVVEVMCHWLDRGCDGWRLDAAYAVPASFWAAVLPRVRERHPDAYFMGEVIHGDYAEYVSETGLDSVTEYELWKSIWSSLNDGNLHELAWTMKRHDELLESFAPFTFVGNHDVTRVASKLTDPRHLAHALAVLFTVGGTPCIYYGDEQGFRGIKEDRAGGDDAVRPAFPSEPGQLDPVGRPVFELHQILIGLRRRHPWLHQARTSVDHLTNDHCVYTSHGEGHELVVALNLADEPATVPAPDVASVLAGECHISPAGAETSITVPAHGWAVLRG
jgi:cyclomaltodextrinase